MSRQFTRDSRNTHSNTEYVKCCVLYSDSDVTAEIMPITYVHKRLFDELKKDFKEIKGHEKRFCDGKAPLYCFEYPELWEEFRLARETPSPKILFFYKQKHYDHNPDFFNETFTKFDGDYVNDFIGINEFVSTLINKFSGQEYTVGLGYVPKTLYGILRHLANGGSNYIGSYDVNIDQDIIQY